LFPALPMLTLTLSLGLNHLLERKMAITTLVLLLVLTGVVVVWGFAVGDIDLWWVLLLGLTLIAVLSTMFVPGHWHVLYTGGILVVFACLDLVCLYRFIVPMLT
ncbi:MAG: hypothetical protein P1S60_10980, partial [Anaerolineae bacterium]|nr:hypothetical protein [Anaerolineae bacterium]